MLSLHIKNPLLISNFDTIEDPETKSILSEKISISTKVLALEMFILKLRTHLENLAASNKLTDLISAIIQNNMSVAYMYLEKFSQSRQCAKNAYKILKEQINLPDFAARVFINLGMIYHETCEYVGARECYAEAENFLSLNEDDELKVYLLSCLGNLSLAESKLKESKNYHEQALKAVQNNQNKDEGLLAFAYNNLAITIDCLGDFHGAIELLHTAQKLMEGIDSKKPADICIIYNNLSAVYYDEGKYDLCMKYTYMMLGIFKTLEKPDNSILNAIQLNNSGFSIMNSGMYSKGSRMIESALEVYLEVYGNEHLETARIRNNLAIVKCNQRLFNSAKLNLDMASAALEKLFGQEHIELAKVYHNFGFYYDHSKQHDDALRHYTKSLEIYQKYFGEAHPHISIIYNNLGCSFSDLGLISQGLKYYKKSLDTKFKLLLGRDIDVARTCRNFGKAYKDKRMIGEAIKFYKKSCLVDTSNYDKYHQDVVTAKSNLEFMMKEAAMNDHNTLEIT